MKVGNRVQLVSIDDTWTRIKAGEKGTVLEIDEEQELIWIMWDNGEKLALLNGVDKFKVIKN